MASPAPTSAAPTPAAAAASSSSSSAASSSPAAAAAAAANSTAATTAGTAATTNNASMKAKIDTGIGTIRSAGASLNVHGGVDKSSVLIIYTGGTIGMKPAEDDVSRSVLRPASGYIERMLQTVPDFHHPDVPTYDVLEWDTPLDSSDFSPDNWVALADQIQRHYYEYDGFVILHGTDTMAYTASALSFMLENLGKAVIITGAMIPLAFPVSDAKRNLIVSLMCAAHLDIPEVCIFFNNVLLRGNRAKKIDPGTVNPFHSPNFPPLAEMGVRIRLKRDLILQAPRRTFGTHRELFGNIAVMVLVPGFDDLAIESFISTSTPQKPAVLVLMLYGAGNAPSKKRGFIEALRRGVAEKGAVIVILSQCLYGSVDMSQYATGSILQGLGVIDGKDMTTEAAVTKLAYLLGKGLRGSVLKAAMESNLRGELTTRNTQEYTSGTTHGSNSSAAHRAAAADGIAQEMNAMIHAHRATSSSTIAASKL